MKARPNSWTIVLFSPSGQIIGWCGILEFHHRCYANMFINQRYRRQGYATTLIRHTLKKFIPVHVAVWDGTTTKLCRKLTQQFPGCIVPYQWTETKNRFDRLTRLKS
jgi:GNAT superfamily N-acetyltransferase